ncbi:MAG: hypothetical protein ACREJM_15990, partial [Candidatus Saccharimonadales bacterium]
PSSSLGRLLCKSFNSAAGRTAGIPIDAATPRIACFPAFSGASSDRRSVGSLSANARRHESRSSPLRWPNGKNPFYEKIEGAIKPMLWFNPVWLFWCLTVVHLVGLMSACLTRLSEGSLGHARFQRVFVGCLALTGLATLASLSLGPNFCMVSRAALVVTILTATWDVGTALL